MASYYGVTFYTYSGITHEPRDITQNRYLCAIGSYLEIVLPEFQFNSAMVHKYIDGQAWMPYHSDDEEDIEENSEIVTVSLGETRLMQFKEKDSGVETNVTVSHGEMLLMDSQYHFLHSIP